MASRQKVHENVNWISPIFIIPKFQNKGIASTVIEQLFGIYPNTIEWRLDTIKQETGNCHLYEKYGFVRVGEDIVVNEKMTLVKYVKIYDESVGRDVDKGKVEDKRRDRGRVR